MCTILIVKKKGQRKAGDDNSKIVGPYTEKKRAIRLVARYPGLFLLFLYSNVQLGSLCVRCAGG